MEEGGFVGDGVMKMDRVGSMVGGSVTKILGARTVGDGVGWPKTVGTGVSTGGTVGSSI